MTCPRCEAFDVLGWLDGKGIRLKPWSAYVVRHLIEHPTKYQDWAEAANDMRTCGGSVCWQMRKKGLPPPSKWMQLSYGLWLVKQLRRRSDEPVYRIGSDLGYAGHEGVTKMLQRAFGIGAAEARLYGSDRLVELWWSRHTARKQVAA